MDGRVNYSIGEPLTETAIFFLVKYLQHLQTLYLVRTSIIQNLGQGVRTSCTLLYSPFSNFQGAQPWGFHPLKVEIGGF